MEPEKKPDIPEAPAPGTPTAPSTPTEALPAPEPVPALPAEIAPEAPAEEKPKKKPKKRPVYEMKLFERYDLSEVVVHDAGLAKYINLSPIVIPHTGGRWAAKPFGKAKTNVVERLINGMMRTEVFTGKKAKSYRVVRSAFQIIEKKAAGKNPVQVLVDALEKAAPREEVTRLRFGGISVPRAVDVSPQRRLDMAKPDARNSVA